MEYKQCCLECGFHFFYESKCPNCEAERFCKEYEEEWQRQLRLLERATGISSNHDFWTLWNSKHGNTKNWFRNLCRNLAPEIYDSYIGIEREREWEQVRIAGTQTELFEQELPF